MKKCLIVLLALCLLVLSASVCLAATKPTVSFVNRNDSTNGGFDYELQIKIRTAQEADLPVEIRNNVTGETFVITIPAGETTASTIIPTEEVTSRTQVTFSFVDNDAYANGSDQTLNILTLPKVQFYLSMYYSEVGSETTIQVLCNNPNSVASSNNVFTLKDHEGNVLCEKKWSSPDKRLSFKFTPTEDMLGRNDYSVWLGDYCVTAETGYGVITNGPSKAISELSPDLPIIAIGIDCGFEGKKTYEILDVLEKYNAKVTFFITGYFFRNFPEECKAILAAGHEIATHSDSHEHIKELSNYEIYREIITPVEEAEALLGVTPRLFRPPYGEYNKYINGISRSEGMEVIMWGPTYHDSTGNYTEKQIMSYATTGNDYQPGMILLCHVNGYYQPDSLEAGLAHYESLGLSVVPISAMLYASGCELPEMPHHREALVYTDEYWATWIEREMPELLAAQTETAAEESTEAAE